MRVLILDNYDSFVYNLVQYVGIQGARPEVYRNDEISLQKVKSMKPDAIMISPGPGSPSNPRDFGVCTEVLRVLSRKVPTLGVCLGHQGIGYVYGAKLSHARVIMHGKTSKIKHNGEMVFKGLPNPMEATRYHSLVVQEDTIPPVLEVTAKSLDDGEVMGVRHREYPIQGVQFHPESITTAEGMKIVKNFLDDV
jgi:anthranilate synthase/aminodeoxychorismate synthase-like glutamine amidotransferase